MIKAVFIDVDNTLLDFGLCAKSSMKQALALRGIEFEEEMFPIFERRNDMLWAEVEQGKITVDELYEIRWELVFRDMGLELEGKPFEKDFLRFIHESAEKVDFAEELMKYLSAKYLVYIISNAPHGQQCARLENAGLLRYTSDVFTSELIGCAKPDGAFYDGCFSRLGDLRPDEVMLIGDSLSADIYGGIEYGLHTCWFNFKKSAVPDGLKAEHIVYSLQEITEIL